MGWQAVIRAAARDHDAGSWTITRHAAEGLAVAAAGGEEAPRDAIRLLFEGQPSMAALRNLANTVATAATDGGDAAQAARGFVEAAERGQREIVGHAVGLLRQQRRAVTISAGSLTEQTLLAWGGPALVLESRPRCEGRALAGRLARAGNRVELAVDAAGPALLADGDVVVLGADSVTPAGVSNKIGSWALAVAAHSRGLPVYVLAGREKLWPEALSDAGDASRDPREVLPEPLPNVQVRDPYFELVPFSALTAVVTAGGPRSAKQVTAALREITIHAWLRG